VAHEESRQSTGTAKSKSRRSALGESRKEKAKREVVQRRLASAEVLGNNLER
jgi:hypothetical protein